MKNLLTQALTIPAIALISTTTLVGCSESLLSTLGSAINGIDINAFNDIVDLLTDVLMP